MTDTDGDKHKNTNATHTRQTHIHSTDNGEKTYTDENTRGNTKTEAQKDNMESEEVKTTTINDNKEKQIPQKQQRKDETHKTGTNNKNL